MIVKTEANFPALKPVRLWIALEPNGKCGMWFKNEQDAIAVMSTLPTLVPVEVPGVLYAGVGVGAPMETEEDIERLAIQEE